MELKYYILHIETNRHIMDERRFLFILQNFNVIYATSGGGQCKALCEDSFDLKFFNIYDTNNSYRYTGVYIENQGNLPTLFDELKNENEDETILIDNSTKWSL